MYKITSWFYAAGQSEHDIQVAQSYVSSPTVKTSDQKQRANIEAAAPRKVVCELCFLFKRDWAETNLFSQSQELMLCILGTISVDPDIFHHLLNYWLLHDDHRLFPRLEDYCDIFQGIGKSSQLLLRDPRKAWPQLRFCMEAGHGSGQRERPEESLLTLCTTVGIFKTEATKLITHFRLS